MRPFRILHIDDDPTLRDVVELSLNFEAALSAVSCAGGADALALTADWAPDLILCDVMMPDMDGPETLARLRDSAITAKTPVIFMTANPEPDEIAGYRALGAAAVIAKPFDPNGFSDVVLGHVTNLAKAGLITGVPMVSQPPAPEQRAALQTIYLDAAADDFNERLRADAVTLVTFRNIAKAADDAALKDLQTCTHKLAGAAGLFGFEKVSRAAAALEAAVTASRAGRGEPIQPCLDALLRCIEMEGAHA